MRHEYILIQRRKHEPKPPYDWRYDLLGIAVYVALIGLAIWQVP